MFATGNIILSETFPLDGAIVVPISVCISGQGEIFISYIPSLTQEEKHAFNHGLTGFVVCLQTEFNKTVFVERTAPHLNQYIGSINVVIKWRPDSRVYDVALVGSAQFSFMSESERDKLFERVKICYLKNYQL
jgi:hypothetical protein